MIHGREALTITKCYTSNDRRRKARSPRPIDLWPSNTTRIRTRATRRLSNDSRRPPKPSRCCNDSDKRSRYDRFGHAGVNGQRRGRSFSDVEDIFSAFGDIFGDLFGGGRSRRTRVRKGRDVRCDGHAHPAGSRPGCPQDGRVSTPRAVRCTAKARAPRKGANAKNAPTAAARARSSSRPASFACRRLAQRATVRVFGQHSPCRLVPRLGASTQDGASRSADSRRRRRRDAGPHHGPRGTEPQRRASRRLLLLCLRAAASALRARRSAPDLPHSDHLLPGGTWVYLGSAHADWPWLGGSATRHAVG